mmetsp:Transcript_20230/g.56382  ORF Transcript_20230/g.56382 Transcript_20230/m.56382 type:complete len:131 (-) Transcript_20230:233-625(-)
MSSRSSWKRRPKHKPVLAASFRIASGLHRVALHGIARCAGVPYVRTAFDYIIFEEYHRVNIDSSIDERNGMRRVGTEVKRRQRSSALNDRIVSVAPPSIGSDAGQFVNNSGRGIQHATAVLLSYTLLTGV